MPTKASTLNPGASEEARKAAISATIKQLIDEGYEQDQAVAIAHSQADKAMGKKKEPGSK